MLINSYSGIRIGPENNVRHRIRSVGGCVLRRGILVDFCRDIGRAMWNYAALAKAMSPAIDFARRYCVHLCVWENSSPSARHPAEINTQLVGP